MADKKNAPVMGISGKPPAKRGPVYADPRTLKNVQIELKNGKTASWDITKASQDTINFLKENAVDKVYEYKFENGEVIKFNPTKISKPADFIRQKANTTFKKSTRKQIAKTAGLGFVESFVETVKPFVGVTGIPMPGGGVSYMPLTPELKKKAATGELRKEGLKEIGNIEQKIEKKKTELGGHETAFAGGKLAAEAMQIASIEKVVGPMFAAKTLSKVAKRALYKELAEYAVKGEGNKIKLALIKRGIPMLKAGAAKDAIIGGTLEASKGGSPKEVAKSAATWALFSPIFSAGEIIKLKRLDPVKVFKISKISPEVARVFGELKSKSKFTPEQIVNFIARDMEKAKSLGVKPDDYFKNVTVKVGKEYNKPEMILKGYAKPAGPSLEVPVGRRLPEAAGMAGKESTARRPFKLPETLPPQKVRQIIRDTEVVKKPAPIPTNIPVVSNELQSAFDIARQSRGVIPRVTKLFQSEAGRKQLESGRGYYEPETGIIRLLKGHDVTTLFHESFHYFNHFMQSKKPAAWKKFAETFGIDASIDFSKPLTEQQTAQLERAAYAYEQWLASGRAPSPDKEVAYDMISEWFADVYGDVNRQPWATILSPEIKDFFGKLHANKLRFGRAVPRESTDSRQKQPGTAPEAAARPEIDYAPSGISTGPTGAAKPGEGGIRLEQKPVRKPAPGEITARGEHERPAAERALGPLAMAPQRMKELFTLAGEAVKHPVTTAKAAGRGIENFASGKYTEVERLSPALARQGFRLYGVQGKATRWAKEEAKYILTPIARDTDAGASVVVNGVSYTPYSALRNYSVARRSLIADELGLKRSAEEIANAPIWKQEIERRAASGDTVAQNVIESANRMDLSGRKILNYYKNNSLYTPEQVQAMIDKWGGNYATFERILADEVKAEIEAANPGVKALKKFKGSEKSLGDPVEAYTGVMLDMIPAADTLIFRRDLVNAMLLDSARSDLVTGISRVIRPGLEKSYNAADEVVRPYFPAVNSNEFLMLDNGTWYKVAIDTSSAEGRRLLESVKAPDWYKSVMSKIDNMAWYNPIKWQQQLKNLKRFGIVSMPRFMIKNFMRDAFTAAENDIARFTIPGTDAEAFYNRLLDRTMLSGVVGYRMLTDYPMTAIKILGTDNRLYKGMEDWLLGRAGQTGQKIKSALEGDRNAIKELELNGLVGETFYRNPESIASIVENAYKRPGLGKNSANILLNWKNPFKALEAVGSIIERVPRVDASLRSMNRGASAADAAILGRQLTADFSDVSYTNRFINEFSPFWSAIWAGEFSAFRALRRAPRRFLERAFLGITVPTVALTAYNMSDPERREKYLSLDPIQRAMSWHIFLGPKAETHIQIAKPYGAVNAVFTALPEMSTIGFMMRNQYEIDRNPALKGDVQAAMKMAMPSLPMPPAASFGIGSFANRKLFFNTPIIPDYLRGSAASAKEHPSDTSLERYTARFINELWHKVGGEQSIAPANVEHAFYEFGGTMGQTANRWLSSGIDEVEKLGGKQFPAKAAKDISDNSFFSAIIGKDPLTTPYTRWANMFYDIHKKTKRAYETYYDIIAIPPEKRTPQQRSDFKKYKKDAERFPMVDAKFEQMKMLWQSASEVKNTDMLTSDPNTKAKLLKEIYRNMNDIGTETVVEYYKR